MRARRGRSNTLSHVILIVASMAAAAPIAAVILIAFDAPNSPVAGVSFSGMGFANFGQVWRQGGFAASLMWSTIIAVVTVAITLVTSVPAGFAFANIKFPGRSPLFLFVLFGLLLPAPAILIPLYYELRVVSLPGTVWSVILPQSASSIAFGVFWMRAVFSGLPRELLEAARVDGAATRHVFARVALPLVRSPVFALILFTFLWCWNAFMLPLIMLAGSNIQTATLSLSNFQGAHTVDLPGEAGAAVLVFLPMVVLYVLTQRHFVRGLTEGGLKM